VHAASRTGGQGREPKQHPEWTALWKQVRVPLRLRWNVGAYCGLSSSLHWCWTPAKAADFVHTILRACSRPDAASSCKQACASKMHAYANSLQNVPTFSSFMADHTAALAGTLGSCQHLRRKRLPIDADIPCTFLQESFCWAQLRSQPWSLWASAFQKSSSAPPAPPVSVQTCLSPRCPC
jgi:hypothetical protein